MAFAAAREGHLVDVLSYVDMRRYTPSPALVFNAFLSSKTIQFLQIFVNLKFLINIINHSVILVIPGNIESLIDFFSFAAWMFYGVTMLSLVVLRYRSPYKDKHRPYKVGLIDKT